MTSEGGSSGVSGESRLLHLTAFRTAGRVPLIIIPDPLCGGDLTMVRLWWHGCRVDHQAVVYL